MNKITIDLLESFASPAQCELFRATFPAGAELTDESVRIAIDAGLDVRRLARLVPEMHRAKFEMLCKPIDDEYWTRHKSIDAEYWAKRKPLTNAEYRAKCRMLDDECHTQYKTNDDERTYKFGMLIIEFLSR